MLNSHPSNPVYFPVKLQTCTKQTAIDFPIWFICPLSDNPNNCLRCISSQSRNTAIALRSPRAYSPSFYQPEPNRKPGTTPPPLLFLQWRAGDGRFSTRPRAHAFVYACNKSEAANRTDVAQNETAVLYNTSTQELFCRYLERWNAWDH